MKFDVLCFGSASCDIYTTSEEFKLQRTEKGVMLCQEYGAKVPLSSCEITTGGGATNTAVCFERLGFQVGIIACCGNDYWGRVIRVKLSEEGVSLVHIQRVNMPTSTSIVMVGKDGGRTVMVYRSASNELSHKKVDWDRLDSTWIYSSSLGGDFEMLEKIIKLGRQKQIKIAFNPGGNEIAKKKELEPFLAYLDLLILNKEEAQKLFGSGNYEEKITRLGIKMTLITNGAKGVELVFQNGEKIKRKVEKAKVLEETGAGDAFGSSFVAGILKGLSVKKSLDLASFNAKSVVEKIGPKEGLLFWPEAKKFLEK